MSTILSNATTIQTVGDILKALQTAVSGVEYVGAKTWLDNIKVGSIDAAKTWIVNTNITGAMTCLQSSYSSAKILELNPQAKSLAALNSQNKDVESAVKKIKSLEGLVEEWKKIELNLPKSRLKRAAPDLQNAKASSKNLGDISTVIRKLSEMLKMETDLTTLIQGSSTIDSTIDGITDLQKKDQLKKMWNQEAIDVLKTNLEMAKKVSGEVSKMEEVKNISNFKTPFEMASDAKESHVYFKDLADSLNGKITDQKLATSLESLKPIDLTFASYEKTKIGGVLGELETYFDSIFAVKPVIQPEEDDDPCGTNGCNITTTTEATSSYQTWIIAGIVGLLAVIAGVLCYVFRDRILGLCNKSKPDSDNKKGGKGPPNKPKTSKGSKNSSASTVSKSSENSQDPKSIPKANNPKKSGKKGKRQNEEKEVVDPAVKLRSIKSKTEGGAYEAQADDKGRRKAIFEKSDNETKNVVRKNHKNKKSDEPQPNLPSPTNKDQPKPVKKEELKKVDAVTPAMKERRRKELRDMNCPEHLIDEEIERLETNFIDHQNFNFHDPSKAERCYVMSCWPAGSLLRALADADDEGEPEKTEAERQEYLKELRKPETKMINTMCLINTEDPALIVDYNDDRMSMQEIEAEINRQEQEALATAKDLSMKTDRTVESIRSVRTSTGSDIETTDSSLPSVESEETPLHCLELDHPTVYFHDGYGVTWVKRQNEKPEILINKRYESEYPDYDTDCSVWSDDEEPLDLNEVVELVNRSEVNWFGRLKRLMGIQSN